MRWALRLKMLLLISSSFFSPLLVCWRILLRSIFAASSSPRISCCLCFSYSKIRQSMQSTYSSVMQNAWTFFLWVMHEILPSSSTNLWWPSVVSWILNSSGDSLPLNSCEPLPSDLLKNYSRFISFVGWTRSGLLLTVERFDLNYCWSPCKPVGEFTCDRMVAIAMLRRA